MLVSRSVGFRVSGTRFKSAPTVSDPGLYWAAVGECQSVCRSKKTQLFKISPYNGNLIEVFRRKSKLHGYV